MTEQRIQVEVSVDFEDLIPTFLTNRQKDIREMRDALAVSDFDALRVRGHTMRGCGSGYGFDPVTDLGTVIEAAAKQSDAGAIGAAIDALEVYLGQVDVVFVDEPPP